MNILYFLFGSCLGSWICASAYRYNLPELKQSKRSICPICHHKLPFYDLIPVISWIHLKGKCRFCHHEIPFDHLLCEVLCGLLIMLCMHLDHSLLMCSLICVLVYAAYTDMYHGLIPDRCHVLILLIYVLSEPYDWKNQIIFSLCVFCVLYLIAYLTQALGYGDVKYITSMSLFMNLYALSWMICIASTSALIFNFTKRKKDKIRFAPYLSFACFVVLLFSTI